MRVLHPIHVTRTLYMLYKLYTVSRHVIHVMHIQHILRAIHIHVIHATNDDDKFKTCSRMYTYAHAHACLHVYIHICTICTHGHKRSKYVCTCNRAGMLCTSSTLYAYTFTKHVPQDLETLPLSPKGLNARPRFFTILMSIVHMYTHHIYIYIYMIYIYIYIDIHMYVYSIYIYIYIYIYICDMPVSCVPFMKV